MLGKFFGFLDWLRLNILAACVLFGLMGLCLGIGAVGMQFFLAFIADGMGG